MKRVTWLVLLVVILSTAAIIPANAITWGELDTEHPNVGAMIVDWPDYGPWLLCSGTLIHPKVFLTAAHCTYDLDEIGIETVWVNFNQNGMNPDTMLLVEQVVTHPDYGQGGSAPHDIAALILDGVVLDIPYAFLSPEGFLDELKAEGLLRDEMNGAPLTLVGYGGTLDWPPPEISYDDLRRVSYSEYKSLTPVWLHMAQNINQDNGGTCFGDSGGPIFWTNAYGSEYLVGLTSWGDAQCVATSFNYRVDTPESVAFIEWVIELAGPTGEPLSQ